MAVDKKTAWSLQVAGLFIGKYQYSLIRTNHALDRDNGEVWLVNKDQPFPVVRISSYTANSDHYEIDRIMSMKKAIDQVLEVDGKLLCIHLSSEDDLQIDESILEVSIAPDYISNHQLDEIYPELSGLLKEEADYEKTYQKAVFDIQRASYLNSKQKEKVTLKTLPVTYTVILVCVVLFFIDLLLANRFSDAVVAELLCGAYYKTLIFGNYAFWRFFTGGFVHSNIFHLISNMYALHVMGPIIEKEYGKKPFLIILFSSIVAGSLSVAFGSGNNVTMGISGGIYGLLGTFIVFTIEKQLYRNKNVRNSLFSILAINLLISFMPNISLLGHLGGFVCGVLLGILFSKRNDWKSLRTNSAIALGLLAVLLIAGMLMRPMYGIMYTGTDMAYVDVLRKLDLKWYSEHTLRNLLKYYQKVGIVQ